MLQLQGLQDHLGLGRLLRQGGWEMLQVRQGRLAMLQLQGLQDHLGLGRLLRQGGWEMFQVRQVFLHQGHRLRQLDELEIRRGPQAFHLLGRRLHHLGELGRHQGRHQGQLGSRQGQQVYPLHHRGEWEMLQVHQMSLHQGHQLRRRGSLQDHLG